MGSVRKLLEEAPNAAVQGLESLLSSDGAADGANAELRALVTGEAEERRLRSAVFSPLAPLFRPPGRIARLCFPSRTPDVLWRAIKRLAPEAVAHALELAQSRDGGADHAFDALCAEAALILSERADDGVLQLCEQLDEHARAGSLRMLLALAPLLRSSVARLPAWLLNAGGDEGAAIRLAYKDAAAVGEDGGVLLIEALFAHAEESPQILRLISAIMDRPTDRYLAASELKSFGERLLDDIEARIDVMRLFDPRRGLEAGVTVASAADAAVSSLTEFEQQVALSREGVWGSRIGFQRRSLALVMEMRLREVEPAVHTALPLHATRGGGRLKAVPNVNAPPDPASVERAFALLALLDGCRGAATHGGFSALRAKVVESLDAWLESYSEDMLELLRSGGNDPVRLRAYLEIAAEFTALVRDPEAARIVRRRAAAA